MGTIYAKAKSFWNTRRVELGYTVRDVANFLGCGDGVASGYLSGSLLPSDEQILKLCDLLCAPHKLGREETLKAFKAWGEAHSDTYTLGKGGTYYIYKKDDIPNQVSIADIAENPVVSELELTTIFRSLYGTLSYDDFMKVNNCTSVDDLKRSLYGLVDYKTFMSLFS